MFTASRSREPSWASLSKNLLQGLEALGRVSCRGRCSLTEGCLVQDPGPHTEPSYVITQNNTGTVSCLALFLPGSEAQGSQTEGLPEAWGAAVCGSQRAL